MATALMEKIDLLSDETTDTSLDLFSVPTTRASVERGEYQEVHSSHGAPLQDKVEFEVGGTNAYTDLRNSYVELEVKVVKANGGALPTTLGNLHVVPGDNFFHSLFERVTLRIANKDVEYEAYYPIRSFMINALNFSKEAKKSSLEVSSGWYEDSLTGKTYATANADQLKARRDRIAGSPTMTCYMRPRLAFMDSERYIFPGLSVKLEITRTAPAFVQLGDAANPADSAKILITKAVYHVRRAYVNPSIFNAQVEQMVKGARIKYPITRTRVQYYTLDQGTRQETIRLDQQAQHPNRGVVVLADAQALSGSFEHNAFTFKPYNLTSIELKPDGRSRTDKYELDFATGAGVAQAYAKVAAALERYDTGQPFGITLAEWKSVANFYAFDFTSDLTHDGSFHLIEKGTLTLKLTFGDPLPGSVIAIILQEYDDLVEFDVDRNVSMISSVL